MRRSGPQELMGLRGLPFGGLDLENVRVPAELALAEPDPEHTSRLTPAVSLLVVRGRLYIIAAPALAAAKLCLGWAHDFVARRSVDGRGLGEYEEIRRRLAESRAETFALESTARWSLLGEDQGAAVNLKFEQNASKNICSVLGWRIVERTLSMLAGEGYETAQSKQRRQVTPAPWSGPSATSAACGSPAVWTSCSTTGVPAGPCCPTTTPSPTTPPSSPRSRPRPRPSATTTRCRNATGNTCASCGNRCTASVTTAWSWSAAIRGGRN
ncbi:acyl-CoA dehydrogenase family protein [Streptomyces stramineus]